MQLPPPSPHKNVAAVLTNGSVENLPRHDFEGKCPFKEPEHVAVSSTKAIVANGTSAQACPHLHHEQHAGVEVRVNRCPFGHGSVGAGPFPGYVHGTHTSICSHGCK